MKRYYPELLPKRVNNVFMRNKTQAPNPAFHNPQSTGQPFSEHRLGEKGENCSKSRRVGHFFLFRYHNTYNRRTSSSDPTQTGEFETLRLSLQSNTKSHPNVNSPVASRGSDKADIEINL